MTDREEVVSTLTAAKGLLEKGWTKGYAALDEFGQPTTVNSPDAASFCMAGALQRAACDALGWTWNAVEREPMNMKSVALNSLYYTMLNSVKETMRDESYSGTGVVSFNDAPNRTKEEVLGVLGETIERVKAK